MKTKIAILAAGAAIALSLTGPAAQAMPLDYGLSVATPLATQIRVVCDAYGRCFRTRPRVRYVQPYADPYYAPPAVYVAPGVGIGLGYGGYGYGHRRHGW